MVQTCSQGKKYTHAYVRALTLIQCHLYDKPKATLKTMRKASLTSSPTLSKQ